MYQHASSEVQAGTWLLVAETLVETRQDNIVIPHRANQCLHVQTSSITSSIGHVAFEGR